MSRQSTTLVTTTQSTQMLRLTTRTPRMRWLHHCTFRSEKQVRAYCKLITRKRERLFQGAQPISSRTERPVALHPLSKGRGAIACFAETWSYTENWMSQKRKSSQESANCQIKIIIGTSRWIMLAAPKSEILRYEYRGDLAEIYSSWRDNLNHKQ